MGKDQLRAVWSLGLVGGLAIALAPSAVWAQLVPDGSLGVERSVIQKINELSDRIDGGAARGANLFHSFQEFNVGQGRSVYFANPVQIQNILSRVTGGNASNILGRLGVLGSANLFLINPNGIIFGPNSNLDIQGSFFATTADGIRLGDKGFFSATEPGKGDLLSVSPGALFFNQAASQAGNIINGGNLAVGGDLTLAAGNLDLQGQLLSGGNLTLQAWDGVKIRDTVESPFVAAAVGDLLVQGNQSVDIFALNNPQSAIASYGNLTLKSPNPVIGDAHYWSGGNFRIETLDSSLGNLQSIKDPIIRTGGDVFIGAYEGASLHIIAGGSVTIPGFILITGADPQFGLQETITLSNGQQIQIDGKNNPTVDIRAGVREDAIGIPFFQGSGFDIFYPPTPPPTPPTSADINLGTIVFSRNPNDNTQKITGDVLLTNQYQPDSRIQGNISVAPSNPFFGFIRNFESTAIDTSSFSDGGRVTIDSRANISISGIINSVAFGQNGRGGDVLFNSVGDISMFGSNLIVTGSQGGNITFNANNIDLFTSLLQSGIQEGLGFKDAQGGDIRLNAKETILINSSLIANGVLKNGIGDAGKTVIKAKDLFINGSSINSNTLGKGKTGTIEINVKDNIFIGGESLLLGPSAIVNQVQATGIGDSQGIVINTSTLTLQNGANIDSSTFGEGKAGLINIIANESIQITGESSFSPSVRQSGITSQVIGEGNSEGIIINTPNLTLKDGGRIDASTLGKGNAGLIQIISTNGNILLTGESSLGQISEISSQVKTGIEGKGDSGGIVINASTSTLTLEKGGGIYANTLGKGNAGLINITAKDISITGEAQRGEKLVSGIFSQLNEDGEEKGIGDSGGIKIDTSTLRIQDGGSISASTYSLGNAGLINITARDNMAISGESLMGLSSNISSQVNQQAEGNSEGIVINSPILKLENGGFIDASTGGLGNTGLIDIQAREISLTGKSSQWRGSVIGSRVEETGRGKSEGIIINSNVLNLEDGGFISAPSTGNGDAGNIIIDATKSVSISGNFFLETENRNVGGIEAFTTGIGDAGNITINTPQLTISEGAGIEAFTSGEGTAGNITINAPDSIILNSDTKLIVETSDAGTAGNININTPLLTIGENAQLSATATATSTAPTAGNINLNVNQLNISGELGIFAETNSTPTAGSLTIHPYENNPNLNIQFTENGFISARTTNIGNGGSISLTAPENIDISGLGSITAETSGIGNAGNINITTENLTIRDGVEIRANTSSVGDSGNIVLSILNLNLDNATIEALTTNQGNPGSILISKGENQANQVNIANNSTISTEIRGEGNPETAQPANITINSENLSLTASQITASTTSNRDAGNINLNNNQINLDNGRITAITSGSGKGGNISIPNTQTLNLINNSGIIALTSGAGEAGNLNFNISESVTIDSGSFFNVETEAGGKAGQIIITSPVLTIGDNAELSARSQANATGEAGNITLTTNQLNISGELGIFAETESIGNAGNLIINPLNNNPNLIINFFNKGKISASTLGDGDGGDINITAPEIINISGNGSIQVEANSSGDAGEIFINANNQINLSNGVNVSSLTSGNGKAGNINLTSENLNLTEGVTITASTTGDGDAGSINLSANNLNFNQTEINAVTNSTGNAGNILINYQQENANNLTLTNSTISTEIQANGIANQPSNITIKTDNLNSENSTITASTRGKGNAGNIAIVDTENINLNNSNIIATTSGEGNTGEIELTANNTLRLNHSQVSSSVEENAIGNSQQIILNTPNLRLNQSNILAETARQGNAGSIIAPNANTITLDNSTISTAIAPTGIATQPSNITLNSQKLTLDNNSRITASTQGKGNAGNITVPNAQQITLNQSEITASTSGEGDTGVIDLKTTGNLNLTNSQINSSVEQGAVGNSRQITLDTPNLNLNNSQINATTAGQGNAGSIIAPNANTITLNNSTISTAIAPTGIATQPSNITLNTQQLTLNNNSRITASTQGKGNAGNITVPNAQQITLNQSEITASTSGEGDTGVIDLKTTGNLNLTNSQISSSVEQGAVGNSRQITLDTPTLNLNNSQINATTAGQGNAGNIIAPNANIINLNNSTISTAIAPTGIATQPSNITLNTQQLTLNNNSRITASTQGKGNAGNITVPNAQTISLDNNSQINASTSGEGNAGDIALNAQTVTLNNGSAITTTVNPNAIGQGGNISLQTTGNSLTLKNQSQISSRSQGQGNAGNILINSAGNVTLTNSDISTSAEQASGGAITITARNLQLNGDSNLRTNVASGAGGGGDILLTADSILAFGDSDILAFARDGKGGNITFNTPIFFAEGFQPIPQDPNSLDGNNRFDINASGAVSGIVTSPDLSFIRNSLIDLPENLIDIENLIANSCVVPNRQKAGTFVITGSGGLPTRPGDASMSSYSTGTVRAIPDKSASSQSWQPGNPIIEPQSVYRLSNGKLVLSRECP